MLTQCAQRGACVSGVTGVCFNCCHAQTVLQDCDEQQNTKEPLPFGIVSQGWDLQFVSALAFLSQDHSACSAQLPAFLLLVTVNIS